MDRDEFMELIYETFADEPDNVLANGIIEAADAYAEHEKAQLSQEGTTSDLISRQAVLDAIVQCTNCRNEDTLREYVLKHSLDNGWTGDILEALDAVKDLPPTQPELTDEQVIDYCKKKGYKIIADDLFNLLSKPEPRWIPVSERMPRDGTWNIFTDGKNISVERYKADAIDHFFPNGRWFQLEDVIAWMPLPEPYRG